ncbi:BQ5605_C009g05720 [Microbotryum silenes-dioicae]|uniref:BQ5605_C009g05720 protein n=1 Tax=Microbotryum silenes-dioicae TaxID=796604 RepID=A0A2X0PF99_9BASI|nr:BQ5605_C009g05720 [Microbotryum silenes-dioicae]
MLARILHDVTKASPSQDPAIKSTRRPSLAPVHPFSFSPSSSILHSTPNAIKASCTE